MLIGILQADGHGRATEVRALWGSTNGAQCINSGLPKSQTSMFDCSIENKTERELLFGLPPHT